MMTILRLPPLRAVTLAGAAALLLGPSTLEAQTRSLTWVEETRMEIPGSLGLMVRLFGGSDPVTTPNALHLQGRALIQESGDVTIVTDLEERRWLTVDHANRTYTSLTFDEMTQLAEQAVASIYAASRDAPSPDTQASREELESSMEEAQAEIRFRVNAESTNQRQSIGGVEATRHFITTEYEVTETPEGVEQPEGGSLYVLAELWQTDDVPTEQELLQEWATMLAADPAMRELGERVQEAAGGSGEDVAVSLAAWDPQVGAGLAETAEAISEMDGTTVRSVVTVAAVALGQPVDREALLAWEPASMGATLANAATNAATNAARDAAVGAARNAVGGLGGMFGRGRQAAPEPEPEPEVPPVQPLFRVITTRNDVAFRESSDDVLGALRSRMAEYRETTFEDLSREMR